MVQQLGVSQTEVVSMYSCSLRSENRGRAMAVSRDSPNKMDICFSFKVCSNLNFCLNICIFTSGLSYII